MSLFATILVIMCMWMPTCNAMRQHITIPSYEEHLIESLNCASHHVVSVPVVETYCAQVSQDVTTIETIVREDVVERYTVSLLDRHEHDISLCAKIGVSGCFGVFFVAWHLIQSNYCPDDLKHL